MNLEINKFEMRVKQCMVHGTNITFLTKFLSYNRLEILTMLQPITGQIKFRYGLQNWNIEK